MQVASQVAGEKGKVWGLDLLAMKPLSWPIVRMFQKDIFDKDLVEFLEKQGHMKFHVVLSDAAPNTTGIKERDQALSHELSLRVLEITIQVLKQSGNLVIKIFDGPDTPELLKEAKKHFARVNVVKPEASTKGSKELYLVARNYKNSRPR